MNNNNDKYLWNFRLKKVLNNIIIKEIFKFNENAE
jgi:hypothetical protein